MTPKETTQITEYETAFEHGLNSAPPLEIGGYKHLIVKEGYAVQDMENSYPHPRRACVSSSFLDVPSFSRYIQRFKNENTAIFANYTARTAKAIIDYHQKAQPEWCSHLAKFVPELTPEWERWIKNNGMSMPQAVFIEFLEDLMANIQTPPGAEILELCSQLDAIKKVDFKSGYKKEDGSVAIKWEESIEGKGSNRSGEIRVPSQMVLNVRAFKKSAPYEIKAYLRYRIKETGLNFFYKLVEPERVLESAFDDFLKDIHKQTQIEPYLGAS